MRKCTLSYQDNTLLKVLWNRPSREVLVTYHLSKNVSWLLPWPSVHKHSRLSAPVCKYQTHTPIQIDGHYNEKPCLISLPLTRAIWLPDSAARCLYPTFIGQCTYSMQTYVYLRTYTTNCKYWCLKHRVCTHTLLQHTHIRIRMF